MDALIEKLRLHWQQNKVGLRSGIPPKSIEKFEVKYNIVLPSDLRHYHLQIDGMEEGESDNELFAFLPLSQIRSVPEELTSFAGLPNYSEIAEKLPDAQECFVFVDYMIMSHVYAIRLSPNPNVPTPVFWISGPFWEEIAPSFSVFIEKYLTDTNSIFSYASHDNDGKHRAQMEQYVEDFKHAAKLYRGSCNQTTDTKNTPDRIWRIFEKLKVLFGKR